MSHSGNPFVNEKKQEVYKLEYDQDGVFLTVNDGDGKLTKDEELGIIRHLRRKNIEDLQSTAIFEAMYSAIGKRTKIAKAQKEEKVDEDVEIIISRDQMEAYIKLLPPEGGELLTLPAVSEKLNSMGVTYGIDDDIIRRLLDNRQYDRDTCVARGIPPRNGRDAKVTVHIEFHKKPKPEIKKDGSVDYHQLDMITNVKKGQVLATLQPAEKGVEGKTVLGGKIAAKNGKTVRLPRGKNTILSEDNLKLIADIDGKAELINGKINVFSVFEVENNVDNSTGDIDFIGNVIIYGNVLTGFEVKSGGNIEVKGVVEGAKLIARGDITLKQGIQGMGRGIIEAGGNVVTRYIENGTVVAKGDVIAEAIMHSNIQCEGRIQVAGRKGLVIGGSLHAGSEISAILIGSPMETVTELEVGVNPSLRIEYQELIKQLDKCEAELKKADQALKILNRMEKTSGLPQKRIQIKSKTIRIKLSINQRIPEIKGRILELEEKILEVDRGKVNARSTVFPGVRITIGNSMMYVKEEIKRATFIREHGDIRFLPYNG